MRWGEDKTVQFVQLYKELECLWNIYHPDYKNKFARIKSMEHLVDEMDLPEFTIKDAFKKIRSLRSTFNQELKKVTDSLRNGAGPDQVYRPTLRWYDDMNYIMKNYNCREHDTLNNSELDLQQQIVFEEEAPDMFVGEVIEEAVVVEPTPSSSFSISANSPFTVGQRKRSKRSYHEHQGYRPLIDKEEDECGVIAKHIAMQLRQLPTSDMLQANVEIQQVLLKYRLANFDRVKYEISTT